MNTYNSYINGTASDYDMTYKEVEEIYDAYYDPSDPSKFYEMLELFITNRNKNLNQ